MNPSVIQLLIDLADQKAKAASIALASALKNEQSTKDKSNTLYQFASQYEGNLSQKALAGISISEYRNTRQFISNIEKIAVQQATYIQFAKDAVSQRQADFREIEKKLQAKNKNFIYEKNNEDWFGFFIKEEKILKAIKNCEDLEKHHLKYQTKNPNPSSKIYKIINFINKINEM
jgi:flagellar export protein FliJ